MFGCLVVWLVLLFLPLFGDGNVAIFVFVPDYYTKRGYNVFRGWELAWEDDVDDENYDDDDDDDDNNNKQL